MLSVDLTMIRSPQAEASADEPGENAHDDDDECGYSSEYA
jgi:hypothetical protein